MSRISTTLWPLQPHTEAKHAILRRYLGAWLPILGSSSELLVYVDGFAGPGRYEGGEKGSPIIALDETISQAARLPTTLMLFIEADRARFEHLRREIDQRERPGNIRVDIRHDEFADRMPRLLDWIDNQKARTPPIFAFIDPFGFAGIPMSLVRRIMQYDRCEVFITFMYESINRFIEHPEEDLRRHFNELFGRDDWLEMLDFSTPRTRRRSIHDLYVTQLREVAGASYVRSFEMVNVRSQTEYFLVFGTNGLAGLKKMKAAMWKVDNQAGGSFSDTTNEDQIVLLSEPDYQRLEGMIYDEFCAVGWVRVERIEEFVLTNTAFRETHFKKQVLAKWERSDRLAVQRPGKGRNGTFPAGTEVCIVP